jgi:PAS domain S-box-containing protein
MEISASIYKSILKSIGTAVILSRDAGTIVEANQAACDLFGYTEAALKQVGLQAIIDATGAVALEPGQMEKELAGIKKCGQRFWVALSQAVVTDGNGGELTCSTIIDISARKRAENEHALLVNNTRESIVLLNRELNIVSCNRQLEQLYKQYFGIEIVKGHSILEYAQPHRKEIVAALYERVLQGNEEESEVIIPLPDGSTKYFTLRYHPATDENNGIIGVLVTATDASAEKQLQQQQLQLAAQQEQHTKLVETILHHLPIGIAVNQAGDGKVTFMNKRFGETYGWSEEDMCDVNSFFEKVYPDEIYRQQVRSRIETDIASGDPENMDWKDMLVTTSTGKTRVVNARNIPLHHQNLMISTVIDVTNEYRHAAEIKRTKANQDALINGTNDMIWSVDKDCCLITANQAFLKMMKAVTGKTLREADSVLQKEFGEELNSKWNASYKRALAGERYTVKEQVYDPVKKEIRYGKTSFNPMVNSNGEVFGVACYSEDITEDTLNLMELEAARTELSKIMDSSLDMICAVDANGIFIKVSAASETILGYKPAEMVGRSISDFIHPDDVQKTQHAAALVMEGKNLTYFENRYAHKNGTYVPLFWSARWNEKEGVRYGVARDATEKKKAEALIIESEEKYRLLFQKSPLPKWIYDMATLRILDVNDTALLHYGYSREEFLAMTIKDLRPPAEVKKLMEVHRKFHNQSLGAIHFGVFTHCKKDGSLIQVEVSGNRFTYQGRHCTMIVCNDVTEQVLLSQQLSKSQQEYKSLFEQNPDAVFSVDLNGNFISANESTALIGETDHATLMQQNFVTFLPPHEINRVLGYFDEVKKGIPKSYETSIITAKGNRRHLAITDIPIKVNNEVTGVYGIIKDITRQKEYEEELKFQSYLLNAIRQAVIVTRVDGEIIYWNEFAEKLYGWSKEEVMGRHIREIVNTEISTEEELRVMDQLLTEGTWSGNLLLCNRQQQNFTAHIHNSPIFDEQGRLSGVIAISWDVSNEVQTEVLLKELNVMLEKRAAELEMSNAELERFAYVASHDLQEPLRMVTSFLQLLEKKYKAQLDETAGQYIHFAVDGAKRMKVLIMDLLQYSRVGTSKDVAGPVDMNDVAAEVIGTFSESVKKLEAVIHTTSLPVLTPARRTQMVQLLQNLVGNALKYHGDKKPEISIAAVESNGNWVFSVKDNGIGFDKKFAEKVFVIFQRLHNNSEYAGTGIGLSICKKIVELNGGRIWVESIPGTGSTFYFSFPKNKYLTI